MSAAADVRDAGCHSPRLVFLSQITEKDAEALAFCTDVRCEELDTEEEKGFKLTFDFAENPFFSNTCAPSRKFGCHRSHLVACAAPVWAPTLRPPSHCTASLRRGPRFSAPCGATRGFCPASLGLCGPDEGFPPDLSLVSAAPAAR